MKRRGGFFHTLIPNRHEAAALIVFDCLRLSTYRDSTIAFKKSPTGGGGLEFHFGYLPFLGFGRSLCSEVS